MSSLNRRESDSEMNDAKFSSRRVVALRRIAFVFSPCRTPSASEYVCLSRRSAHRCDQPVAACWPLTAFCRRRGPEARNAQLDVAGIWNSLYAGDLSTRWVRRCGRSAGVYRGDRLLRRRSSSWRRVRIAGVFSWRRGCSGRRRWRAVQEISRGCLVYSMSPTRRCRGPCAPWTDGDWMETARSAAKIR